MKNLLLFIEKSPLITWKALLVLWALFLGFIGLVIKLLEFMGQFSDGHSMSHESSDDGFEEDGVIDKSKTYQNGLDGAQRFPGRTFYH